MNEGHVTKFLERYGAAVSAGDPTAIAACWSFPALLLSDQAATSITDSVQMEKMFSRAIEQYRSRGIVSTKFELERADFLSEKLASVDVRWPGFDSSGEEKWSERSHYLVQLGADGQVRLRVALTRTT